MNIKIKQRDITDCGAACLASVAAYHNLYIPVSRIRQWAGTDKKGTNAWGIIKAAEKMGLHAKGVRAQHESLSEIPLPAIAHVILENKLHHYVVIYKVHPDYIQVMDPGTGKLSRQKTESFDKEWSGVLILLSPGNNFKKGDEKISNFRRFRFLLYPHRKIIVQALFGAVIFTLLGLSTSVYIQKITDFAIYTADIVNSEVFGEYGVSLQALHEVEVPNLTELQNISDISLEYATQQDEDLKEIEYILKTTMPGRVLIFIIPITILLIVITTISIILSKIFKSRKK